MLRATRMFACLVCLFTRALGLHTIPGSLISQSRDNDGDRFEATAPWEAPTCNGTSMCGFVEKTARPHDFESAFPPSTGLCFWVSEKYKFIGIKVAKTGGSTFLKNMKYALCGITFDGPYDLTAQCPDKSVFDHGQMDNDDCIHTLPRPNEWDDYFVFAVVRNPWARRESIMHYCEIADINLSHDEHCGKCTLGHCKPYGSGIMSPGGASFVDFVGHAENLNNDMETILHEVVKRYAQKNSGQGISWLNATVQEYAVNVGSVSDYAQEYEQMPGGIEAVKDLYPIDTSSAFGYRPPPIHTSKASGNRLPPMKEEADGALQNDNLEGKGSDQIQANW